MNEINAEQDLAFIKKVIQDSRRIMVDNGIFYISWGILVVFGLIFGYICSILNLTFDTVWIWVGIIGLGWLYTFWIVSRRRMWPRARTFAGKILLVVWCACGIAMSILGFVGYFTGAVVSVSPFLATVMGVGYFVSGFVSNHAWIRNLAFGWWGGAILIFIWSGSPNSIIFGLMMILFQILPGLILYSRWKQELASEIS